MIKTRGGNYDSFLVFSGHDQNDWTGTGNETSYIYLDRFHFSQPIVSGVGMIIWTGFKTL